MKIALLMIFLDLLMKFSLRIIFSYYEGLYKHVAFVTCLASSVIVLNIIIVATGIEDLTRNSWMIFGNVSKLMQCVAKQWKKETDVEGFFLCNSSMLLEIRHLVNKGHHVIEYWICFQFDPKNHQNDNYWMDKNDRDMPQNLKNWEISAL